MTKTMKVAVVREFGKPLVIEEAAIPSPGAGQILVKIAATGVCHTNLRAAEGDWPVKPKPPFILGHEGVGHVVAVGSGVRHMSRKATGSVFRGSTPPAAIASIAWVGGKRGARNSRTPVVP